MERVLFVLPPLLPAIFLVLIFLSIPIYRYVVGGCLKGLYPNLLVSADANIFNLGETLAKKAGRETFGSILKNHISNYDSVYQDDSILITYKNRGFESNVVRIYSRKRVRVLKLFSKTRKTLVYHGFGLDMTQDWYDSKNPRIPYVYIPGNWEEHVLECCKKQGIVESSLDMEAVA